MNHAGTVSQRDIRITRYVISLFMLLFADSHRIVKQRFIFFVFQFFSLISVQNLIRLSVIFLAAQLTKHGIKQRFRHIIRIAVGSLHFRVRLVRIHAKSHVRRQRPGGCRPCQNIRVLILNLKSCNCGTLFYILIPLRHFMR